MIKNNEIDRFKCSEVQSVTLNIQVESIYSRPVFINKNNSLNIEQKHEHLLVYSR